MLRAGLFTAALLLGSPGAAAADGLKSQPETDLADWRLAEPDAFGRFTDVSRRRPGGVFAPEWDSRAGRPRRRMYALTPTVGAGPSARSAVPAPAAALGEAEGPSAKLPGHGGLALLFIGALVLAVRRTGGRTPAQPAAEAPVTGLNPPSPKPVFRPPPRLLRPRPTAPQPAAAPRPAAPGPRLPWWAITAAEQEAIYRWDASVEKRSGGLSLAAWLDAHERELKGVNIWRLKEKLWRDV